MTAEATHRPTATGHRASLYSANRSKNCSLVNGSGMATRTHVHCEESRPDAKARQSYFGDRRLIGGLPPPYNGQKLDAPSEVFRTGRPESSAAYGAARACRLGKLRASEENAARGTP